MVQVEHKGKLEESKLMPYLGRVVIIVGELDERYGYSFKLNGTQHTVLLQNEMYTSFGCNDALAFQQSRQQFLDPTQ
ncbi:unnamed protein product [Cochlearia groenlandica]